MPTFPQINLNGTHGPDLLQQNLEVLAALKLALRCMSDAFPNGRDFQTAHHGVYATARREAEERGIALGRLIETYEAIAENLSEQIDARKR